MDLHQKTYFLITGASKGIGKSIALECCRKFKKGSIAVLLARCKDGLAKTKKSIESLDNGVIVKTYSIDLTSALAEDYKRIINDSFSDCVGVVGHSDFDRAFIVHNAGSPGELSKKARDLADMHLWSSYYQLNLFSVIGLNCEFMKHFDQKVQKLIVNITSKCGSQAFPGMSLYCTGKAAREMYFKVLATEEGAETIVVSYSPGPVDTDMSLIVQEETLNEDMKIAFRQQRESKTMLTPEQTTLKLIDILQQFKFQSGDVTDYFD